MDPYSTYPYANHASQQPQNQQIITSHYGTLKSGNHIKYENYDNGYDSYEPEWQYPANHNNQIPLHRQHIIAAHNHQNQINPANLNIGHSKNGHHVHQLQNQPYIGNNYVSGLVEGGLVNNLSLNHNNVGNHTGQHAVVRQLQEKFAPVGNGDGDGGADGDESDREVRSRHVSANGGNNHNNHPVNSGNGNIPSLCCGSVNDDQNGVDDGGGNDGTLSEGSSSCLQSFWLHCRIPLLLMLVVFLLILLLSFSGALIYFKYVPYKTGSFVGEDEPCENTPCAFGANCYVDGGRALCRCPEFCSTSYSPVCGSDEKSYSNECLLRQYSCQNEKSIRIKHAGECNMPDPCADKACLYGSRCVASSDGHYATCECPASCPNYGDSDDSQPVCGSDGRYHRNRCELDRQACRLGRNITVKYVGKCDPCEDILCTQPQVCHLDEGRRPICRCSEMCTMDFNPVCGSDGKTYSNECVMRQESCRTRRELRIIYRGKCSSGVNPCESRTCRGYESCAINRFGIAQCTCAMVCDPVIQPVCGSDGRTYDNHCELTLSACKEAKQITLAYKGTCEGGSACAKHTCQPGATCSEKNGEAVCECPVCPSDYDPVCGSDGVSYQNDCRLRLESCITNTDIMAKYSGLCNLIRDFNRDDGCDHKQCDFYSVCESDLTGTRCICPENCSVEISSSSSPVCGTDGVTYDNECELQKSGCRLQKFVVVASKGHCDLCANVQCKSGARCENGVCVCPTECEASKEILCGSNLVTYMNECELQKAACRLGRPLNVHFYGDCTDGLDAAAAIGGGSGSLSGLGTALSSSVASGTEAPSGYTPPRPKMCESIRCDFGAMCELGEDGFPRCTCQFNCTVTAGNPVCASDLKLYPTECEMRREACHRQTELRPRPMELCEEVRPCNGDEPLKHPGSDEDINCGSGPTRTNCPTGSFCHRSPAFAKCCKKSEDRSTTRYTTPKPAAKCEQSIYGCCPDGLTSALGPKHGGCPSVCQCNKLGSAGETCDPVTLECQCRPGVGGPKCDRCLPGFWGLPRIAIEGHQGCMACGCSKFGSVRDDCEQMTGRCVCKPGVLGHKCDSCGEGEFLGPYGCTSDPINLGRTCEEVVCSYGAECEQDGNRAGCICNIVCSDQSDTEEICASDGFTYESECLVRMQSCRNQKPIWVVHKGPCPDSSESDGTESPIRRWTGLHYTEPGDDGVDLIGAGDSGRSNGEIWRDQMGPGFTSSGMKSTRHLPPQSKFQDNFHKNFYSHRSPTSATIQLRSYLGDSCQWTSDCVTAHSLCLGGWCICREGFYEDSERIQCKPIHSHLSGVLSCSKTGALCQPPASCFDHRNGSYSCVCPLGKSTPSEGCLKKEYPFPFFSGKSSVTLGKLAGYHKLSVELEITPYMNYAHGILVFSSQHGNGSGDFLSLALIDGYVEFRFDLGDGPAILRSASRLISGSNYHIVAKRYNRDGLLRVDGEEDVKGTSPGTMKSLNLDHGGYMGFTPLNSTKVWETVGTSEGFVGCIHKLKVGRRPIEFEEKKDPLISSFHKVSQCPVISPSHRLSTTPMYTVYELDEEKEIREKIPARPTRITVTTTTPNPSIHGNDLSKSSSNNNNQPTNKNPCSKNPCQNHGLCWNDRGHSSGYKCVCHPEYTGRHCESRTSIIGETGAMLDFRGFSYLEVPKIENGARHVSIELWVMIRERNGLILYNGQESGKGDYISLTVSRGHIQFLFDLGSGMANLTWTQPILLNKWHWIVASREGREGKLQVDGQPAQTIKSPPTLSELNLELPLYIGGIRDMNMVHRELGILTPFDGALQYVRVNGETYYREIASALKERIVHRYEGPPCGSSVSHPCNNGGTCFPRLESFVCLCPPQFSGKSCESRKEIPGPVRFDGQNFLKFPRKVAKHESFNFSDYDDFYNEHFDSQLDELFGDDSGDVDKDDESALIDSLPDEDFVDEEEFVPLLEHDFVERVKAQRRNRIEIVFRTTSETPGVVIWTGKNSHRDSQSRRGYLGLFIVDGFPELRIDLGAVKNKRPVIIRSKVKVTDGRWHQVLIARRRRLIVLQVDGSTPQRATAPVGSNVLVSDGRFWIGGVAGSILPGEVPASYHQGFVGCVDLVRIEKRRLPLSKIAYATGTPFCEDED